ncbi:CaiB/BaiF CoA transferase family protein [Rhizomonospora bruguierae]|uniref:CaiB/BaiF CoA transferase family protein n=1 Tax=Rhizomonospora bruguierae TaxID=1581705 RepID=UPI001BD18404|nr:CoA transferase [Micromonospora sp. NBRC 107566]
MTTQTPDSPASLAGSLSGFLVLDFTWSVLGPTMTRNLASFGAEVIKVEWPRNPDPMRKVMYAAGETDPGLDNGPFFNNLNIGKRSLTLDAKSERGREIVRRLVARADVVAESFSSRVFRDWGLGYEELAEINPAIIYVSASGFGHSGPYERYEAWGPTAQALTGITAISGMPGHPPAGWGWSYLDTMGGSLATVAVLAALNERERTGVGQYVDVSQTEAGIGLTGPSFLDVTANGRSLGGAHFPPGNRAVALAEGEGVVHGYRGDHGVPYNSYRTAGGGHNDYCVITVLSDDEWIRLVDVMGRPAWATDPALARLDGRLARQDDIDEHIGAWTATYDKYELMRLLQRAGIRCGAVQSNEDLAERDEQLRHRDIYPELEHPLLGRRRFEGVPVRSGDGAVPVAPQWPLLGEGNDHVLRGLLGMSADEVAELDRDGVTWPLGVPRNIKVARSLW